MDDVAADLDAEISADGSWERVSWVGGTEHLAAGLDGVQTLPDHGDDWAGAHVLHQSLEERAGSQISVVLFQKFLARLDRDGGKK